MLKKTSLTPKEAAVAAMADQNQRLAKLREIEAKLTSLEKRVELYLKVLENPDMPKAEALKILAQVSNRKPDTPKKKTKAKAVFVPGHIRVVRPVTKKTPAKVAAKAKPANRPAKTSKPKRKR